MGIMGASGLRSFLYSINFQIRQIPVTNQRFSWEQQPFLYEACHFENYYKRIGFSKENSYYSMKHLKKKGLLFLANKLIEKILDPPNGKERFESFIKKTQNQKNNQK